MQIFILLHIVTQIDNVSAVLKLKAGGCQIILICDVLKILWLLIKREFITFKLRTFSDKSFTRVLILCLTGLSFFYYWIILNFSGFISGNSYFINQYTQEVFVNSFIHMIMLMISVGVFSLLMEINWSEIQDSEEFKILKSFLDESSIKSTLFLYFAFLVKTFSISMPVILILLFVGAAPLNALGLSVGAAWYYHIAVLPVLLIYIIFPSVLAVLSSLLVSKFIPNRIVRNIVAGINFFGGFLGFAVLIIAAGRILPWLLRVLMNVCDFTVFILPLNLAVESIQFFKRGEYILATLFYIGVVTTITLLLILLSLIMRGYRSILFNYVYNLEYFGFLNQCILKNVKHSVDLFLKLFAINRPEHLFTDWKKNYLFDLPLLATFAVCSIIFVLVYVFLILRFVPDDPAWNKLSVVSHIGVSGFIAYLMLGTLKSLRFVKDQNIQSVSIKSLDIEAFKRYDCKLFKDSSLSTSEVVWYRWVAFFIPSVLFSAVILIIISMLEDSYYLFSGNTLVILILLLSSFVALDQWTELVSYKRLEKKGLLYVMPYIWYLLALVWLVIGQVHDKIWLFTFLHNVPHEDFVQVSLIIFIISSIAVFLLSLFGSARVWKEIEI